MSDRAQVLDVLASVLTAARRVRQRSEGLGTVADLTSSEQAVERLDAICMQLLVLGESLKRLDRITGRQLLPRYPQVDWRAVKGLRDVIGHDYGGVDAAAILDLCRQDIPVLIETVERMVSDLEDGSGI